MNSSRILERHFDEVLNYLLSQAWFFELEEFVEETVCQDDIFEDLKVHDYKERLLFARAFFIFAQTVHASFEEYKIHKNWVRYYLFKSATLDRYTRDVIVLASIPGRY